MYKNLTDLLAGAGKYLTVTSDGLKNVNIEGVRETLIDELVNTAVFAEDKDVQDAARWLIWYAADACGAYSASIHDLYFARGKGEFKDLTVPAVNVRGLSYDFAQAMFNVVVRNNVGPFLFEIARSEIGYTFQRPAELVAVLLAAAVKSGYQGPVCMQGDHFQFKATNYKKNPQEELNSLKALTLEAIDAGFYNIDIDASTLVDLDRPTVREQQKDNYELTSLMTEFVRGIEPKGVTVSLGGEIGEVGHQNSTVEEMEEFMNGHLEVLKKLAPKAVCISKISVQSGTSHGGVVLPDGSIAEVALDFDTLQNISAACQDKFDIGGAVQHGASTLPKEAFDKFPQTQTIEVHLATGFQNLVFDHPDFPADMKAKVYAWLDKNAAGERKADMTDEQFYYKTRKKGFGPFKSEQWNMPAKEKQAIMSSLEDEFTDIFKLLNVFNTKELMASKVKKVFVAKRKPICML